MTERYVPPSIDDQGGIKPFLESTKHKHNGYNYNDLEKLWNWGEAGKMNITNLARMFRVSWITMDGWITRMHKEAGKPRLDREGKK